MIASHFNVVFSIRIFHEYFENSNCNCLVFNATVDTDELIRRYGFKIKKDMNGFSFYSANKGSLVDFLNYIETTTQQNFFEFELNTTNPNFTVFTAIPTNWIGQLQCSSKNVSSDNENLQLTTTYLSQSNPESLGKLKVYFQDLTQLMENNSACHFQIKFQARATQWQYYIINNSRMSSSNLAITGKSTIDFGNPTPVTIQSGKEALLFSSGKQLIEMSEVSKYQFDLIYKSKATALTNQSRVGKIIFKGLPNPSPKQIEIQEVNGTQIVTSPMYVYI